MQIRLWGIPEENKYILELLQRELKDKIKIISSVYQSKNNNTQRIYIEIDLENKNYRKYPTQTGDSKTEKKQFNEPALFEEIKKRIAQNQ
jgi:hypothetical protein